MLQAWVDNNFLRATLMPEATKMVCWLKATSSDTLLTPCYFPNPFLYLEKEATTFYPGHNKEFIMGHSQEFPLNFFSHANNKLKVCKRFRNLSVGQTPWMEASISRTGGQIKGLLGIAHFLRERGK